MHWLYKQNYPHWWNNIYLQNVFANKIILVAWVQKSEYVLKYFLSTYYPSVTCINFLILMYSKMIKFTQLWIQGFFERRLVWNYNNSNISRGYLPVRKIYKCTRYELNKSFLNTFHSPSMVFHPVYLKYADKDATFVAYLEAFLIPRIESVIVSPNLVIFVRKRVLAVAY